jgi:hypothetical protein
LKARIAFRVLIGAGLYLAWLGLLLPWQTWRVETEGPAAIGADGSFSGFDESRPFWIVLVVVTLLAVVALWRHKPWAFVAIGVLALPLIVLVVREIGASLSAGSAFVSVEPGAGAVLSLAGPLALIAAVVIALRPRGLRLAGALAAPVLAAGLAVAWPQADGRPGEGAIADALDASAHGMAFQDDTLYRVDGGLVVPEPDGDHEYGGVTLWDFDWSDRQSFPGVPGRDIAFAGGTLFASLGELDRLISITRDGERSMLVARPPAREEEPAIPDGETQVVEGFTAGPLAAAPDGSVYTLHLNGVARWRDGRLETVAGSWRSGLRGDGGPARRARFDHPSDIATDARGAVYVADTWNGRVRRIGPDGTIETVVGTEARAGCVGRGLDDPLSLDIRSCIGVRALAVDREGNLYLALRSLAMIVGVDPEGRLSVVAGTGPKGWSNGRAVQARLGVVEELAVGPDGDLYVSESAPIERVRRIADPAGILAAEPEEPEASQAAPACREIAGLMEATVDVGDPEALERSLGALAAAAPEEIRDDVDEIVAEATGRDEALTAISFAMEPRDYEVGLGDYAEEECRLVGGFDVPVEDANELCIAYSRYMDRGDLAQPGEEPPDGLADVIAASPPFLAETGRAVQRELQGAAGRAVPDTEAARLVAALDAIDSAALSMCALR